MTRRLAASGRSCTRLRAAIAASEATKDVADTINVPAGMINISNDLVIQSDITIVGVSARTTIIDGGAKYRGFRITVEGTLRCGNLTIRNGAAGGGARRRRRDPQPGSPGLDYVRITAESRRHGGGIANSVGRVQADNLLIDNNVPRAPGRRHPQHRRVGGAGLPGHADPPGHDDLQEHGHPRGGAAESTPPGTAR